MPAPVSATYRLQLHPGFTFDAAAKVVPYLAALGISHVYCSPYLQAAPGSTHGYDVIDHTRVNHELGGEAGFDRFVAALRAAGLGQVLDIVPNHMAISTAENRWWSDVLENGPSSHFAAYFDVEWDPPEARMRNTVLVPILGDHYGRELERGALTLERDGARFRVRYAEHAYPVAPRSLALLLGRAARLAGSDMLAFLADAFGELPRPTATDRASVRRRHRDKEILRAQLQRLLAEDAEAAHAVDRAIAEFNAEPESMHALLEMQMYRLAWWRSAARDLGYRRFFDINTLIGLRMEDEQVFHDTHRLVLEWIERGILDGLRIDHPDGLRDPQEYFDRLRAAAPDAWIVAEKVLEPGEPLRETFPIQGTTGYDFLNLVLRLFVDPAGEAPLTAFYAEFTGEPTDYAEVVHDRKLFVLREVLGSDVNRLTDLLLDICERHLRYRDYSRHHLTAALRELVACFPVYRTYVRPSTGDVSDRDRRIVCEAATAAAARRTDLEPALFDFLRDLLLPGIRGDLEDEFTARFQQLTGPAMAKGVEDTAFYTYNRFVALNEVGGDPSRFSIDPGRFHAAAADTLRRWPLGMLTTATHDTKRGEDVRARLALLSECPAQWAAACRRWSSMAARHRTGDMPDRNAEYLLYQTLVGAWPIEAERLAAYMEKATREAKVHTSWTAPNAEYDRAVRRFIDGLYGDVELRAEVEAFVAPLVAPGRVNALAQTLIRLTAPGVPDTYQGTELWSLSLVDPDNRRPVDFEVRLRALAELDGLDPVAIAARADEGLPKLHVVREALALRRRQVSAFGPDGTYTPLEADGNRAAHVVAFARGGVAVTIVPRLVLTARGDWSGTTLTLPAGTWRNVLTRTTLPDGPVALDALWQTLPVALLERT
ncbi:MAG TPA: malto-oligosyltrehalose synthase [Vicinamibacterales bacterium]